MDPTHPLNRGQPITIPDAQSQSMLELLNAPLYSGDEFAPLDYGWGSGMAGEAVSLYNEYTADAYYEPLAPPMMSSGAVAPSNEASAHPPRSFRPLPHVLPPLLQAHHNVLRRSPPRMLSPTHQSPPTARIQPESDTRPLTPPPFQQQHPVPPAPKRPNADVMPATPANSKRRRTHTPNIENTPSKNSAKQPPATPRRSAPLPAVRGAGKSAEVSIDTSDESDEEPPFEGDEEPSLEGNEANLQGKKKRRHWQPSEVNLLLHSVLAPDGVYRAAIEDYGNANGMIITDHYFKKMSEELFRNSRSWKSCKACFAKLKTVFMAMKELKEVTGGAGDVDEDKPDEQKIADKITVLRSKGKDVTALNAKAVMRWETEGWYDLFASSMETHVGLSRQTERHSAAPLSDAETGLDDSGAESDDKDTRIPKSQSKKPISTAKAGKQAVPVAAHKPRSTSGSSELAGYMAKSGDLLAVTSEQMKRRTEIAVKQVKYARRDAKFDRAQAMLSRTDIPDSVKASAQKYVDSYWADDSD